MNTHDDSDPAPATVLAAQRGDADALDELLATVMPLVYNIVGRALRGGADVDDLVQEILVRIVRGLAGLRDPAAFRSWAVAVTVRQVRWHRAASREEPRPATLSRAPEPADPEADFVDLSILRLGLTGQRRETAEATRWLDQDDRELLALWWLEAAGRLRRADLASALGLSTPHTAVRVQRMKQQLDVSRAIVRALGRDPRCDRLATALADWDGQPTPLWRKRLARHLRSCEECDVHPRGLVPAERLLAGLGLVPPLVVPGVPHTPQIPYTPHSPHSSVGESVRHSIVKPLGAVLGAASAVAVAVVIMLPASSSPKKPLVAAPVPTAPTSVLRTPGTAPSSSSSGAVASPPPGSPSPSPTTSPPAVVSAKKGVSAWKFDGVGTALKASGSSWYYTWAPDHPGITSPAGVQFVPMIWGAASAEGDAVGKARASGGSVLLGYNEPDLASQANMTPQQALDLWPKLQATGLVLGSPAVAAHAADAGGWLDQFMQGAHSRGYRVDFIAVHWYGSDFRTAESVSQLQSYLQAVHDRYGLPIWLTEFALLKFAPGGPIYPSLPQEVAFINASTAMLQRLPFVQRYAWFALPADKPETTGLFLPGGSPNAAGAAFEAAGSHP